MKNIYKTIFYISILGLLSCSPKLEPPGYNGEVNYLRSENKGTITVRSVGNGRDKGESYHNAKSSACYMLLFRGFPGSSDYKLPLIADENGKKNDPFVTNFLNGDYTTYITSSNTISDAVKSGSYYRTELELTINCDAVRKYLEQNNVIRKFGY